MFRKGTMTGLLRGGGIEGVLVAGQRLLQLINSSNPTDRVFAAKTLQQVGIASFYSPLIALPTRQ